VRVSVRLCQEHDEESPRSHIPSHLHPTLPLSLLLLRVLLLLSSIDIKISLSGLDEMWEEALMRFATVTTEMMDHWYRHCILSVMQ
jgi:hypothetical protein